MNELQARLSADMKAAMKSKDADRLLVIRLMIAALKDAQLGRATDDMTLAEEQDVLRKMVKSARETIEQAERAGRSDVVERETAQVAIVQEYLPRTLAGPELEAKVRELCAEIGYGGPQDVGRFMKEWMARHKGLAEGRDVQAALKGCGG